MESEFSQELQVQAYGILRSNDMHEVETLLTHLFSYQEPQRSAAHRLLNCCQKEFPDWLFVRLIYVIRHCSSVDIRTRSALVLRYVLCDLWPKLTLKDQITIRNHFLVSIQEENSMPTLQILCGIASELASEISKTGNDWPELFEYLLNSIQSGSKRSQLSALWVFSSFPKGYRRVACETLAPSIEAINSAFLYALDSKDADIQVAKFGAVVSLMRLFVDSSGRNWFRDALRGMMVGLFHLLSQLKQECARGALKELIMLIMEEPRLLKPYLNELVLDMLMIIENEQVTAATKMLVHKLLLTVAEATELALTMRGLAHQTLVKLLTIPMKLLQCINEDEKFFNLASQQGENTGGTTLGKAYLTKISTALGEKTMAPIAFELFLEFMDASDWKKRHAGISMLSVVAKECYGEMVLMENCSEQVTAIILKSFQDPHEGVCCAAFKFMQLPIVLVEAMQILHHLRIVPALFTAFDQHSIPKLKEQAALAFQHVVNNVPLDALGLHKDLDTMLTKLPKESQGQAAAETKQR